MVVKLRIKTIISIIIIILVVSGCYLFFYINKQNENLNLLVSSQKKQVSTLAAFYTKQIDSQYSSRIQSFVQNRKEIIALFAARDLKGLYEATEPLFTMLHQENSYFDHINFILPDNTAFLRMHEPDLYGDKAPYVCKVAEQFEFKGNVPVRSFVYGDCGLYYMVMIPVDYEQEYVGSVLFGIRIGAFIEDIQENLGLSTALALIDAHDDEGKEKAGTTASEKYTLLPYDDPFFTSKAEEIKVGGEEQIISYNNAAMLVFPSYIIKDIHGREIARILQALDLTSVRQSYRDDLVKLGLVTVAVLVFTSIILYLSFNILFSELVKLNIALNRKNDELVNSEKQLETIVSERTNELEQANVQLNKEIELRHDANTSLSRSIKEWQSTFDAIADAVTILDDNLEIVVANKAAYALLGRSGDEIIGSKCYELYAARSTICDDCPTADILATGTLKPCEMRRNYLGRNLHVTCGPIFDGKDFLGFVHTAKDVTFETKMKKQLGQAQKMEAIATLAGGIAHDFKNILGAILGNADLLLYRLAAKAEEKETSKKVSISADDIEAHLKAIKKAGNRAKDLVGQILAFSRQEKTERQNAELTPVIKEGVKLLRSSLAANIEIKSEIDSESCRVNADLSQVHQVFMNLCTNAAQAMGKNGGILDISLHTVDFAELDSNRYPDLEPGGYVALAVKDTGQGMSPEVMERIFDPFFTTRDVSEGTGMGLSVIHGIISSHGGAMDVQSTEGAGSEFTVLFPCAEGKQDTVEDAILGVPRGSEKILFVDDEEDILKMTTRMLEYLGYTVYPATSAEKAIAMLTRESFHVDLIITDYSMTGKSGVQLAKDLLDSGKDIPVILCSGFSDSVILDQEARRVIRKFMSKPLDMKKMAITLREVLSTSNGVNNADFDN